MVDSASSQSKNLICSEIERLYSGNRIKNLTDEDIKFLLVNNADDLSESLIKKNDLDEVIKEAVKDIISEYEKKASSIYAANELKRLSNSFINKLLSTSITIDNFEEIFCLQELVAHEIPAFPEENTRNIRYKDKEGSTIAIVQINSKTNKIRVQSFGNILPKQEFISPKLVNYRIVEKSKKENWIIEDGGINQFDGSIETRYKDRFGNVMAAVIVKPGGKVDTVVEYIYKNNKKVQMHHTNQFGNSKTFYNAENNSTELIIDIDTDGNICSISSSLS